MRPGEKFPSRSLAWLRDCIANPSAVACIILELRQKGLCGTP